MRVRVCAGEYACVRVYVCVCEYACVRVRVRVRVLVRAWLVRLNLIFLIEPRVRPIENLRARTGNVLSLVRIVGGWMHECMSGWVDGWMN